MYKIAVDAMGGDNAPEAIVAGIEQARDNMPDTEFLLFGQLDKVKPLVKDTTRLTLIQSDEIVEMGEEPVKAIRRKKQSSLVMAAQAVKDGEADAIFSAGNTGALLAVGIFTVGRIRGIDRPALLTVLPALDGPHDAFAMMDVGANAENRSTHLYQYGILGSFYAQEVLGYASPRVGLLNNGTEEDKGDPVHKEAHQLLKQGSEKKYVNFIGNVESRDILQGPADVVVADGFSGNAALKATEGTALSMLRLVKHAILDGNIKTKLAGLMLKPAMKDIQSRLDYSQHGGAVVIGVKAPVVKTHGSAGASAVANTMKQIHTMLETNLVAKTEAFVAEHKADLSKSVD